MSPRRRSALPAAFVLALLALPAGEAGAACGVSATGLSFPPYSPFSALPTDGTATVTVTCDDPPPPPDVVVSFSAGGSGSYGQRRMRRAGGPETLAYNLFIDPGMGTVAGDGAAGGQVLVVKNVRKPSGKTATFYGRIPPGQNVPPGSYFDSVTVTITW